MVSRGDIFSTLFLSFKYLSNTSRTSVLEKDSTGEVKLNADCVSWERSILFRNTKGRHLHTAALPLQVIMMGTGVLFSGQESADLHSGRP